LADRGSVLDWWNWARRLQGGGGDGRFIPHEWQGNSPKSKLLYPPHDFISGGNTGFVPKFTGWSPVDIRINKVRQILFAGFIINLQQSLSEFKEINN
jgi:hypothetical protein